jgi:hypothetical protein
MGCPLRLKGSDVLIPVLTSVKEGPGHVREMIDPIIEDLEGWHKMSRVAHGERVEE